MADPVDTSAREDAVTVVRTLRAAGHVAYFAGGCVRDTLLGRPPKDYDVATDAPPERVRRLFRNTQAVGAAFGVVLVRVRRTPIEVATFRTDGTYTDGRRPDSVRFATAEEDANRRDFTINGLFMDPLDNDRVIDYVGGRADLNAMLVRAIGNPDERFAEDHLRLLRAVRFACRLDFTWDLETLRSIERHATDLSRISPERVGDELRRMLVGAGRDRAWRALHGMGLAVQILRFVPAEAGCDWGPHESILQGLPADASFATVLAAVTLEWQWQRAGLPDDVRPLMAKRHVAAVVHGLRQGLKITNEESSEIEGTAAGVAAMLADPKPGVAALKRFLATPTSASSQAMLHATAAAGPHARRVASLRPLLAELAAGDFAPPPLVTGDDLTAAGATPGPAFKRALDAAYDAQLEGRVADRATALAVAMANLT